jgi:nucleotide-binding universal stress UspA family protein
MSARKKVNVEKEIIEEISSAADIASRFAEEAYWDLYAAEKLSAGLGLDTCNQNDEVFYTGRRVLYLLQQASEKAAKAHLITYFKIWLKIIEPAINEDPRLQEILKRRKILVSLEPKQIGHKPHRAIFDLSCGLYELFYKEKSSMLRHVEFFSEEMVELLRKLELPKDLQGTIEQLCKGKGVGESPPCLTEKVLRELRSFKEDFERRVEEALAKGSTEEQLAERAKHLLNEFAKALEDAGRAKAGTKECLERLATSGAETLVHHAKEFILGSLYSYYLLAYFFIVYPRLAIYETIGRYPEYGNRGSVCQDIGKLNLFIEEVRLLVNNVKHFVEELRYLVYLQPC